MFYFVFEFIVYKSSSNKDKTNTEFRDTKRAKLPFVV